MDVRYQAKVFLGAVLWLNFKQAHILVLISISVVVMSELSESRSRKRELW